MDTGRRRAIAGLLAAASAPVIARRQERTLGYLGANPPAGEVVAALARLGHVSGTSLRIEYVKSEAGDPEVDRRAAELVRAGPDALLAYSDARALALRRATSTIPIVAAGISDPVSLGVAHSLARPGLNVTGLIVDVTEEFHGACNMLKRMLASVTRVTSVHTIHDRRSGIESALRPGAERAGLAYGQFPLADAGGVERLFEGLDARRDALGVAPWLEDSLMAAVLQRARKGRVATMSVHASVPESGGLFSYALTFGDHAARIAALVDKVLRGTDPALIPFERPDRVEFVVNEATARDIGLALPLEVLLRATRIIG